MRQKKVPFRSPVPRANPDIFDMRTEHKLNTKLQSELVETRVLRSGIARLCGSASFICSSIDLDFEQSFPTGLSTAPAKD